MTVYGLSMVSCVPNGHHLVGAKRGHTSQSAAASSRNREAWSEMFLYALFNQHRRLTLHDYAYYLTGRVDSASGKPWSARQVKRILDARGETAKSLHDRITRPSAIERKDWPRETYQRWLTASKEASALTDRNGSWRAVLDYPASRAAAVRLADGQTLPNCEAVGQVVSSVGGIYTVSFFDTVNIDTFEMDGVPASALETFVWKLPLAERVAAADRLSQRSFRAEDARYRRIKQ